MRYLLNIAIGCIMMACMDKYRLHKTDRSFEARRLRAWELKQQGWKQSAITQALGVTPGAVSQWLKRAREEGIESPRRRLGSGSPPRLSARFRLLGVLMIRCRLPRGWRFGASIRMICSLSVFFPGIISLSTHRDQCYLSTPQ